MEENCTKKTTRAILAFTANEMLLLLTFYFGLHIVEIAQCPFAFQSKTNRQQQEQWCQYTNGHTITFALLGL